MKKKFNVNNRTKALFIAGLFFLVACGGSEQTSEDVASSDVEVVFTQESSDSERYVANIAIEGMACEMMCGSKIAGTLNELDGVSQTNIEFEGEGKTNYALVEFDATTVSEQEMIKAVESIADGIYSVNKVEVKHYTVSEESTGEDEEESGSAYEPEIQYHLPNIFSVFTRLF